MEQSEFLEKYKDYLTGLMSLPRGASRGLSTEGTRVHYIKVLHPEDSDDFIMDLIRILNPQIYARLTGNDTSRNMLDFEKELDALTEAIFEAVYNYTGRDAKGNELNFFAVLNTHYSQKQMLEKRNEAIASYSFSFSNYEKSKIAAVEKMYKGYLVMNPYGTPQDFLEKLQGTDINANIKDLWKRLKSSQLVNIDAEDQDDDRGTEIPVWDNSPEQVLLSREHADEIISRLGDAVYAISAGITDKETGDYFRIFITRYIMVCLKLRYISHEQARELKLPKEEANLPDEFRGNGDAYGYYRYTEEPAGDGDLYDCFQKIGAEVIEGLLHKNYIDRAIRNEYDRLWTLYNSLLKDEFTFSDSVIAGMKGTNNMFVTRKRRAFRKMIREISSIRKES